MTKLTESKLREIIEEELAEAISGDVDDYAGEVKVGDKFRNRKSGVVRTVKKVHPTGAFNLTYGGNNHMTIRKLDDIFFDLYDRVNDGDELEEGITKVKLTESRLRQIIKEELIREGSKAPTWRKTSSGVYTASNGKWVIKKGEGNKWNLYSIETDSMGGYGKPTPILRSTGTLPALSADVAKYYE